MVGSFEGIQLRGNAGLATRLEDGFCKEDGFYKEAGFCKEDIAF